MGQFCNFVENPKNHFSGLPDDGQTPMDQGKLVPMGPYVPKLMGQPICVNNQQNTQQHFAENLQNYFSKSVPDNGYTKMVTGKSQILALPPCSPQKPLLITEQGEVGLKKLQPYPAQVPDLKKSDQGTQASEKSENNGGFEKEPPCETAFQYVDQKFSEMSEQFRFLQQYLQDTVAMLNNLREACARN